MKLCIVCFLLCICCAGFGQKDETLSEFVIRLGTRVRDTSLIKNLTINEIVGLPPTYKIVHYSICYSDKSSIICLYSIKELPWLLNQIIASPKKGSALTIDEIVVQKDDRTFKLKSKAVFVK